MISFLLAEKNKQGWRNRKTPMLKNNQRVAKLGYHMQKQFKISGYKSLICTAVLTTMRNCRKKMTCAILTKQGKNNAMTRGTEFPPTEKKSPVLLVQLENFTQITKTCRAGIFGFTPMVSRFTCIKMCWPV